MSTPDPTDKLRAKPTAPRVEASDDMRQYFESDGSPRRLDQPGDTIQRLTTELAAAKAEMATGPFWKAYHEAKADLVTAKAEAAATASRLADVERELAFEKERVKIKDMHWKEASAALLAEKAKATPAPAPGGLPADRARVELKPIGPSSDDFFRWMNARSDIDARIRDGSFTRHTGYEIWRNAWLFCESEHGIRHHDAARPASGDAGKEIK